ncbi:hypothetical protein [Bacillus cereus]
MVLKLLYKDGVIIQTPQIDAPYPELSPTQNDPIPATWSISSKFGSGSILYLF